MFIDHGYFHEINLNLLSDYFFACMLSPSATIKGRKMSFVRDDIPLPKRERSVGNRGAGRPPSNGLDLLVEPGQSIPVDDHRVKLMRTAVWREHKKGLARYQVARVEGTQNWRCWRVE